MKILLTFLILSVTSSFASAAQVTSFTLANYSSATSVTCGVFGASEKLATDQTNATPIQAASYDTAWSRMKTLGTKASFMNYSMVQGSRHLAAADFTCTQTGTGNPVPVKLYLNGFSSWFLTLDRGEVIGGVR